MLEFRCEEYTKCSVSITKAMCCVLYIKCVWVYYILKVCGVCYALNGK